MPSPAPPIELLAPAGGRAQLHAAMDAGADAVYFGVDRMNMRVRAENFGLADLPETAGLLRDAGRKAYLTLNTLVLESELPAVDRLLEAAKAAKVDAVIAADWAVVRSAGRIGLPVHISTQLSISNSRSLAFLFDLGVRRVVLARECSLQDMMDMREALHQEVGPGASAMEFEVFAHGAMCVAESGRCFLSGFETGRSASRGDCAQPCRQAYTLTPKRGGEGFELENGHLLSPKDLCTLPFLEQILDAGVASLKIEGRNRSPDYVHTVVSAYREAIDAYRREGKESACFIRAKSTGLESVKQVYNRGFSSGFYLGRPMKAWTTAPGNQAESRREYIGQVLKSVAAEKRTRIRLDSASLAVGDDIFMEGPDTGFLPLRVERLRQDGRDIPRAEKGETVDLISTQPLHPADRLYRHVPRT